MTTRHLKKRDRAWAKAMLVYWKCPSLGRDSHSGFLHRLHTADAAKTFLRGEDAFQQEALAIEP